MKSVLIFLFFSIVSASLKAQTLYSKNYGNPENPAIIFIHGGPSGNSNLFEATTAQQLADKGYYVIVYDRRGEGRSKDTQATMTFHESFEDLLQIYKDYNLEKANILGHSFGGLLATLFTQQYPEKVNSLILAGALIAQQETYDHILEEAKEYFKNDSLKRAEIEAIIQLNKNSAGYRKQCFDLAGEMDFFDMHRPTNESRILRQKFEQSEFYTTNFRNHESPVKFYQNESKNNLDNKQTLRDIREKEIPVYAIYGRDDRIFPEQQLSELKKIVSRKNFRLIRNCSHYLFVDQQTQFLNFIEQKIKFRQSE